MGKRSNFERREADFYPTPRAAAAPLIPICAVTGSGLSPSHAALAVDCYNGADVNITNPPFVRQQLHRLIAHFLQIAVTWLLLPWDWASTKQAVPFMTACTDIVPIGRVKWIEGSEHSSMENYAWLRFDAQHTAGPVLHWRDQGETIPARRRTCEQCGRAYAPDRPTSRFRSGACRTRACRERLSVTSSVTAIRRCRGDRRRLAQAAKSDAL
jgi:hypothetical protein